MAEDVLNVAQLAVRLDLTEDAVQELVRERRIPHVRLGPRRTRFYWPAIETWLADESRESMGSPDPPTLGLVADGN